MEAYFRSPQTKKTYKLHQDRDGKVMLYWVMVWKDPDGSFQHSRGGDVLDSWDRGMEVCQVMASPCAKEDYLEELKGYFDIDKAVREAFIQKYNL